MPSYLLEIIVLVGGLVLLLLEAFTSPRRKSSIAIGAISILCFSLILLFFAGKGFGSENVELTRFYAFDPALAVEEAQQSSAAMHLELSCFLN